LASDDTFHFENAFLPPTGHVNNGKKDEIIPCFSGKGVSCCICFLLHLIYIYLLHLVTSTTALDFVANSTIVPMTTIHNPHGRLHTVSVSIGYNQMIVESSALPYFVLRFMVDCNIHSRRKFWAPRTLRQKNYMHFSPANMISDGVLRI